MKITLFTGNQLRHISLANKLRSLGADLFVISECTTLFPGGVKDFYNATTEMEGYFKNVILAEKEIYRNDLNYFSNVNLMSIKYGDLNNIDLSSLELFLKSDLYIVFGSSYIKGNLAQFLINKKAINIHMGLSPQYRGTACNFWALYDGNPHLVGATVHHLTSGLDDGPILFHVKPKYEKPDTSFTFTMRATLEVQNALIDLIKNDNFKNYSPRLQDNKALIRYSKNSDFNDNVIKNFFNKDINIQGTKNLSNNYLIHYEHKK